MISLELSAAEQLSWENSMSGGGSFLSVQPERGQDAHLTWSDLQMVRLFSMSFVCISPKLRI